MFFQNLLDVRQGFIDLKSEDQKFRIDPGNQRSKNDCQGPAQQAKEKADQNWTEAPFIDPCNERPKENHNTGKNASDQPNPK